MANFLTDLLSVFGAVDGILIPGGQVGIGDGYHDDLVGPVNNYYFGPYNSAPGLIPSSPEFYSQAQPGPLTPRFEPHDSPSVLPDNGIFTIGIVFKETTGFNPIGLINRNEAFRLIGRRIDSQWKIQLQLGLSRRDGQWMNSELMVNSSNAFQLNDVCLVIASYHRPSGQIRIYLNGVKTEATGVTSTIMSTLWAPDAPRGAGSFITFGNALRNPQDAVLVGNWSMGFYIPGVVITEQQAANLYYNHFPTAGNTKIYGGGRVLAQGLGPVRVSSLGDVWASGYDSSPRTSLPAGGRIRASGGQAFADAIIVGGGEIDSVGTSEPPIFPGGRFWAKIHSTNPAVTWPQDDAPGNTFARDGTGQNRTGTYMNGPSLGNPSILINRSADTSVIYNGINQFIHRPYEPWMIPAGGAFTAMAVFAAVSLGQQRDIAGLVESWQIWINVNGTMTFHWSPAWTSVTPANILGVGVPNVVFMQQGNGRAKAWLNGVKIIDQVKAGVVQGHTGLRFASSTSGATGRPSNIRGQGFAYWPGVALDEATIEEITTIAFSPGRPRIASLTSDHNLRLSSDHIVEPTLGEILKINYAGKMVSRNPLTPGAPVRISPDLFRAADITPNLGEF